MWSTPPTLKPHSIRAVFAIVRDKLDGYHLDGNSFPLTARHETKEQQELREEIVASCTEKFQEKHPEVYRQQVREGAERANMFGTERRVLSDTITDIFYREWRR